MMLYWDIQRSSIMKCKDCRFCSNNESFSMEKFAVLRPDCQRFPHCPTQRENDCCGAFEKKDKLRIS